MKKSVFIILTLWFTIIVTFVATQEYTLINGREVLLETVPVDPRDLFRGDYVILNYKIAQVSKYNNIEDNKTVYLPLKIHPNNVASARQITEYIPKDSFFIKGKMGNCPSVIPFFSSGRCINFGIESYFVKEHTGRELETNLRNGALVKVSIDRFGNAKVKGFVKGENAN